MCSMEASLELLGFQGQHTTSNKMKIVVHLMFQTHCKEQIVVDQVMEQELQIQDYMVKLTINVATGIKGSLIKEYRIKDMQLEHLTNPNQ